MQVERGVAADGLYGFAAALVEHVADRHPRPGFDDQSRGFGADPAGRSRNQCDLSIETVHGVLLWCSRILSSLEVVSRIASNSPLTKSGLIDSV
jgi:hypothetical protein